MDRDAALTKIRGLIEKYEEAKRSGSLKKYNEEETKKDFILPLFEALGWNVANKQEVSAEEVQSGGRVDYGFYINDRAKFYLEAKSLSSDLNREEFANQAIRYSWNKGMTWAVLTDFENLKVFNAQDISKHLSDKLFFDIHYSDYISRFDQLYWLTKEAFESDLIDKKAEKVGKKLLKVSVTAALYKDLNDCRAILTNDLTQWNNKVDPELIEEGVQKILDRLIFLRVAEDRGLEPPTLRPLVRDWENRSDKNKVPLYKSMVSKFREFDSIYNSNLFSEHPFENWDDYSGATQKVIDILFGKEGYYDYDFKAMPADVLGTVYENYLGYKLLKSKKKTTVSRDDKKRKDQGIYYTPDFIVDYIVKNALKPVLDKCQSISDVKKIRVLDPACGSGSFLIKAFQLIKEKYRDFGYQDNTFVNYTILLENIYGVDLDPQAVEITRLNLLISALEERTKLPSLSNNIKNGNSLISGTDEELVKYFGKEYRDKKPFNWSVEFPEVFKQGGFDVIIGNPPYIKEDTNKHAFDGLHRHPYYQGKMDIWTMFGCVGIDLLKNNGILGFIAPNNWISNYGSSIFRNKVLSDGEIRSYVDFGDYKVFESASIQTMILIYQKRKPEYKYFFEYIRIKNKDISFNDLERELFYRKNIIQIEIEPAEFQNKILSFNKSDKVNVLKKIESLTNYVIPPMDIGNGIDVLQDFVTEKHLSVLKEEDINKGDGVLILSDDEIEKIKPNELENKYLKPYFNSSQINRYLSFNITNKRIIYADAYFREHINLFPNLKKHIDRFGKILTSAFAPYGLHRVRDRRFFEGAGIFSIRKTKIPSFTYVDFPCYVTRAFIIIKPQNVNLKYLTGILNSSIIFFWLKSKGKLQGEQLQIDKEPLLSLPIYVGDDKQQQQVINLVDRLLILNLDLQRHTMNSENWKAINLEAKKINKEIDNEIYKLYGMTPEEINIVENN